MHNHLSSDFAISRPHMRWKMDGLLNRHQVINPFSHWYGCSHTQQYRVFPLSCSLVLSYDSLWTTARDKSATETSVNPSFLEVVSFRLVLLRASFLAVRKQVWAREGREDTRRLFKCPGESRNHLPGMERWIPWSPSPCYTAWCTAEESYDWLQPIPHQGSCCVV